MFLGAGLENIKFQYSQHFFKEMTAEVSRICELANNNNGVITASHLAESTLQQIVMDGCGVNATFSVDTNDSLNAFAVPPSITRFHPFNDEIRRSYANQASSYSAFVRMNKTLTGVVDFEKCTLGGVFSEIESIVKISYDLFSRGKMIPEEITAIILHEIGHIWTMFATLYYKMQTNLVLTYGCAAMAQTTDTTVKIAIMTDLENSLGIDIPNKKDLIAYDKYEDYYIVILSAYDEGIVSAMGSSSYDQNMSEQMADMFCSRHGGGRYLVTALTKMHQVYRDAREQYLRRTRISRLIGVIFSMTLILPITIICMGFAAIQRLRIFMTVNWIGGRYDNTKDRFIRIRNESVAALKEQNISGKDRTDLLAAIAEMDEIIKNTTNEYEIATKLAVICRSGQRKQYRAKRLQQDLEALLNNPLYINVAKFKS